jgi:tetratricopeptide (TPR) repeat protein
MLSVDKGLGTIDAVAPKVASALTKADANARKVAQQYMLMATAYKSRGDVEQAMKQLGKAVKKAPHFADPYLLRGHLHRQAGDLSAAGSDYLDCFRRLDGPNATVEALLADLAVDLTGAGLFADAVRLLQTLSPVAPLSRPTTVAYAIALCGMRRHEEALVVLDQMNHPEQQSNSLLPPADVRQLYISIYEATGALGKAEQLLLGAVGEDNSVSWKDIGERAAAVR